jgi:hypothetical protein
VSTIQTRFLGVMRTSSNVADPAIKKRFLVAGASSMRFDACLKLDFLAPAVLTILVGGFMRLAFFALVADCAWWLSLCWWHPTGSFGVSP